MTRKDLSRRKDEMTAAAHELEVPTEWHARLVSIVAAKGPLAAEQAARVRRAFTTPV